MRQAEAAGEPVTRVDVKFTAFRLQLGWLAFSLRLGWADPKVGPFLYTCSASLHLAAARQWNVGSSSSVKRSNLRIAFAVAHAYRCGEAVC